MADALQAGAAALQGLIRRIGDMGDADLAAADDDAAGDTRDYQAMAAAVQADLAANLGHDSPEHRQGYLRALTDLLCMVADGAGPGDGWDPIQVTASAFARPEGAHHA